MLFKEKNVRRMLRGLTEIEWAHWKAYLTLNPQGEQRADLRAALIAQAIWNVQIAKTTKRGSSPAYTKLTNFLLEFEPILSTPTRKMTEKEKWDVLKAIFQPNKAKRKT